MSKSIRLTAALTKQIASAIHAGGYPHVAAEAFGVPKDRFDDWLKRGNAKDASKLYRSFAHEVRTAFAQARLCAEMAGFKKDPKLWLVNGPGRESEQQPGWSVGVKPATSTGEARNALREPELMHLMQKVLEALRPFPDARLRVAQVLAQMGIEPDTGDKESES